MNDRPNILVVMSDDHAQWASTPYGHTELRTPGMARLADTGCVIEGAYTPCPVCSPARACFFTGRYPSQHGIHDWIDNSVSHHKWMARERTLGQILQEAGYETGLVGKWHLGQDAVPQPGFETWFCYERGQYPHQGSVQFSDNGAAATHFGHNAEILTQRARRFLSERDRARPFFLFVGYVDTHSPFTGHPHRLVSHYRDATFCDVPRECWPAPQGWIKFGLPQAQSQYREAMAQYYAAVEMIDEQLRALLTQLEENGERERTLVVYSSDHGHMNGQHGLLTKGNATVPVNFYEESIRVPCILSYPDHIAAGSRLRSPVSHCDLFHTLLDFAHTSVPNTEPQAFPGRFSIRPILQDPTTDDPDLPVVCEYGNSRMIRRGATKFIQRLPLEGHHFADEFYDLDSDPRETSNRLNDPAWAGKADALRTELEAFFDRFEEPEHSGANVLSQERPNSVEPWRLTPPDIISPEGTDLQLLFSDGGVSED